MPSAIRILSRIADQDDFTGALTPLSYLRLNAAGTAFELAAVSVPVTSVFGRTGDVVAASGDYTAAQVTNAVSTAGSYSDPAWLTSLAGSKISGDISGNAASINGSITQSQVTSLVSDLSTLAAAIVLRAPLASPTFTGSPAAPTPSLSDNSTLLATTAFVKGQGYATTASLPVGANPSASVGLSAVNGSATTFLRSDGAPALDQTAAFTFSALGLTTTSVGIRTPKIYPVADGTAVIQILRADGSTAMVIFDTTNRKVIIGSQSSYFDQFGNFYGFGSPFGLHLRNTSSQNGWQLVAGDLPSSSSPDLQISSGTIAATTEKMRITYAGLVGINKFSSISAQLHVASSAAGTIGQIIQLAASASANAIEVQNSAGTVLTCVGPIGGMSIGHTAVISGQMLTVLSGAGSTTASGATVSIRRSESTTASLLDGYINDTAGSGFLFRAANSIAYLNANWLKSAANVDLVLGGISSGAAYHASLTLAGNGGHITVGEGMNILTGTTTGTKFGTASNQLLAFYGATPVDQPATVADPSGGAVQDAEARTAIIAVIDRLQELGLVA